MENLVLNFQLLATYTNIFMNYTKTVPMYSCNFLITIRLTYEELCIQFSSILIGPKKFY
ncbi:hypothetical protein FWK35_00001761 [Aphis craccivora]|uniref:Uncharacterized protein n=1 Tax=Aphis craccivora TaxID=307492 RepID=A0A6G0ZPG3_APHCR|nr:hypothetical protein FWK35_00001761 [Aphis craccivora]